MAKFQTWTISICYEVRIHVSPMGSSLLWLHAGTLASGSGESQLGLRREGSTSCAASSEIPSAVTTRVFDWFELQNNVRGEFSGN